MKDGVAIVTGGASGIGRALSEALGRRGFEVVIADMQIDLAKEVAGRIGKKATAVKLDVRDYQAFDRLAKETTKRCGRIDYLFNNAGGAQMVDYDLKDWTEVIDVNLVGVTNGIQAVYPKMVAQGGGHIVNTASTAGLLPAALGSYSATKFGVVGVSKALRIEGSTTGVRCSVICPGPIRTPIFTGGKYGRITKMGVSDEHILAMWEKLRPMDPEPFAERVLPQVFAGKAVIIEPTTWRLLWLLERWAPFLSEKLWIALHKKMKAEIEAARASMPKKERENGVDAKSAAG
jgi:NAD(P)-dependent dehydrogenase (short-subunit alcohol dehydrogenase family)